jgi:pilus assembly protein CpaE
MQAFLVCDDDEFGRSIRLILVREGVECPPEAVLSFSQAAPRLAVEAAELIVAVLPDDPLGSIEALDLLAAVPRQEQTLVIAIGPAADAKLVIRALRGVVDDYLDTAEVEAELVASLAGWRQRRSAGKPEGRLIALLGPSGGAGSSTVAASLAVVLAKEFESVALIDLKLETGDLAALLDLTPAHTLADICQQLDRLDPDFFRQSLMKHSSGIHLLAPPRLLADVDTVTAEGVRQSIGLARALFPYVVVDLDHSFREEQMQAIRQADLILMVLRLDFASLRNAKRFLDHLDGLGIAMDRVRLVVNRSGQSQEVPLGKAQDVLKMKISQSVPDDPKAVNRAINNGVPVVLDAPTSKVARSLSQLAQGVKAPALPADAP